MKSKLLGIYHKSKAIHTLLKPLAWLYKIGTRDLLTDSAWCRSRFQWYHGYSLNLNRVRTLNEKIQWLKLYDRNPDYSKWADKFEVKKIIESLIGAEYVVPLLAWGDTPECIDFKAIPKPFIIKSSHASGQVIIIREGDEVDSSAINKICHSWLKYNLYRETREFQYKNIPPRIIVEKLLLDENGQVPFDYKFHCCNGVVEVIQVDIDRHINHKRNLYDRDWNRLPFVWSLYSDNKPLWPQGRDVEKPDSLAQMLMLTEKIASQFSYARVDWYYLAGRIYFGELTFHHGSGFERIIPFEWDEKLGDKLKLPSRPFSADGIMPFKWDMKLVAMPKLPAVPSKK
jgi:hypothetical protein